MQISYYGLLRKLSPEALEQCYGIAGELLRGCCSDAPRLLERAYDALCKSRNALILKFLHDDVKSFNECRN